MPESISSARTSSPAIAEWLLARVTDPTRAAAIMGDLTEMAATRGRLWFWTAYARTLITLGWRAPVAFLCAYTYARSTWQVTALIASMHALFHWVPFASPAYRLPIWQLRLEPLLSMLSGLNFLVPFLLVRFGLRDRLTRLAFVLYLVSLPTFSNRLLLLAPIEILAVIVVVVALCLRGWRRPLVVLALCLGPWYALVEAIQYSYQPGHRALFGAYHPFLFNYYTLAFIVTALLCIWLHRLLLRQRPAIA